jgi:methionyl-tRNA synthetase
MKTPSRYLITSALPYANGPLHIGHMSGAYLSADIYVRYLRAKGKDVAFICGSDEHGAAITLRARKEGVSPKVIVDRYHELMKSTFERFRISFDEYHRTSSEEHLKMSQDFFLKLHDSGSFEVKTTEQYYDSEAGQFLADRYIKGICPRCSSDGAYGDQCEKCGASLNPTDLIQPKSVISGSAPVMKATSHWFLPMQNHESWIREYIEKGILDGEQHHDAKTWKSHVIGQCMSWIDGGLQSRAMTRDLDWGVPVPLESGRGKVLYVWLDAPIGYITNTKTWADRNGKNWQDYWKNDDSAVIHFIGKDNIVFHCIIFPILLKAHGEFNLPVNVPANEFMNLEGQKISTSRNWAVWVHEYLDENPGKVDEMRYVLTSIMPEQKDSEFTWSDFKDRVNNELADILGNYIHRVFVLIHKYYNGVIPETLVSNHPAIQMAMDESQRAFESAGKSIEHFRFREALAEVMNMYRAGNKLLTETEPWKLQKTHPEMAAGILVSAFQLGINASAALSVFLPDTAQKILAAANVDYKGWGEFSMTGSIAAGHSISSLPILFEKITDEFVQLQTSKLQATLSPVAPAIVPFKENISFEEFQRMDLRIVKVLEADAVPKTQKLLKLKIQTGLGERTVISGIAEHYSPLDLIGKSVLYLANLEPRVIKGVKSEGMILMAQNAAGMMSALLPEKSTDEGSTVN